MSQVFVYGSLLSDLPNNRLLADSPVVSSDATVVGDFRMYDLGYFPAVRKALFGSPVRGEVYDVSRAVLAQLDRLESHPHFYCREKVRWSDSEGRRGEAWMYFLVQETDAPSIDVADVVSDWKAHYLAKMA